MDPDSSPKPPAGGTPEPEPSEPVPEVEESPSLLGRLFGLGGNGNGHDDPEPTGREALGPAFRSSSPAELAMVTNILRLRDLRVEDVMTPRADIEAVAEDAALDDVLDTFERGSFSRLPVYCETLDDPRGFVHLKDLAMTYGFARAADTDSFRLTDHVRTMLFVPPSMRIAALMQKMQGERVHMALVIDEFGGVDGLVTIEDLVEQIVGDIEDEHDAEDDDEWTAEPGGGWLIQARADIQDFQEATGLSLVPEDWEEEVDTIGGLVFMLANLVPARGEVIVNPNGHEIEIVDADPRRIKRVRLRDGNGSAVLKAAE